MTLRLRMHLDCGRWRRATLVTTCLLAAMLILVVGLTGCGSAASRPHDENWRLRVGSRVDRRPNGRILATGALPGGGKFTILVDRERSGSGYQLAAYSEMPSKGASSRMSFGGAESGPSIGSRPFQSGFQLVLNDSKTCGGGYPSYALAYGLLHTPRDVVAAQKDGKVVIFRKVTIPTGFHPDGTLVYALLLRGRNDVIVRDASGRIVSREVQWGPKARCG